MEEDTPHFQCITPYYFRKAKTQLKCDNNKNICAVCGEGAVTDRTCHKWFAKPLGTGDILAKRFFAVGLSHALEDVWRHPGLYLLEADSRRQPYQNVQINKVIGGNEKCVFYFMEKT